MHVKALSSLLSIRVPTRMNFDVLVQDYLLQMVHIYRDSIPKALVNFCLKENFVLSHWKSIEKENTNEGYVI